MDLPEIDEDVFSDEPEVKNTDHDDIKRYQSQLAPQEYENNKVRNTYSGISIKSPGRGLADNLQSVYQSPPKENQFLIPEYNIRSTYQGKLSDRK